MNFGLPELIIILVIVLLLFGSTRLPKLSRSLGQSFRELREGFSSKEPPSETKKETPQNKTKAPGDNNTSEAEKIPAEAGKTTEAEKNFYGFESTQENKDQNKT